MLFYMWEEIIFSFQDRPPFYDDNFSLQNEWHYKGGLLYHKSKHNDCSYFLSKLDLIEFCHFQLYHDNQIFVEVVDVCTKNQQA